jgi:Ni/Co efflux regulator RcnB
MKRLAILLAAVAAITLGITSFAEAHDNHHKHNHHHHNHHDHHGHQVHHGYHHHHNHGHVPYYWSKYIPYRVVPYAPPCDSQYAPLVPYVESSGHCDF